MALPQRKEPPEPEPIRSSQPPTQPLGDVRKVDREVAGKRFGWFWMWICIAVAILVVIWIAWGFSSGGWSNRSHSAVTPANTGHPPALNSAQLTGPGVAALKAADKNSFIGQQFQVNNASIQQTAGSHAVWMGTGNAPAMLVIAPGTENLSANAKMVEGNYVNVTGTVEKAPKAAQAIRQWSLSSDDANRLEQQ